ncbi:MAG: hypothetical protein QM752_04905 [Gammaproteobacteria bacterium]
MTDEKLSSTQQNPYTPLPTDPTDDDDTFSPSAASPHHYPAAWGFWRSKFSLLLLLAPGILLFSSGPLLALVNSGVITLPLVPALSSTVLITSVLIAIIGGTLLARGLGQYRANKNDLIDCKETVSRYCAKPITLKQIGQMMELTQPFTLTGLEQMYLGHSNNHISPSEARTILAEKLIFQRQHNLYSSSDKQSPKVFQNAIGKLSAKLLADVGDQPGEARNESLKLIAELMNRFCPLNNTPNNTTHAEILSYLRMLKPFRHEKLATLFPELLNHLHQDLLKRGPFEQMLPLLCCARQKHQAELLCWWEALAKETQTKIVTSILTSSSDVQKTLNFLKITRKEPAADVSEAKVTSSPTEPPNSLSEVKEIGAEYLDSDDEEEIDTEPPKTITPLITASPLITALKKPDIPSAAKLIQALEFPRDQAAWNQVIVGLDSETYRDHFTQAIITACQGDLAHWNRVVNSITKENIALYRLWRELIDEIAADPSFWTHINLYQIKNPHAAKTLTAKDDAQLIDFLTTQLKFPQWQNVLVTYHYHPALLEKLYAQQPEAFGHLLSAKLDFSTRPNKNPNQNLALAKQIDVMVTSIMESATEPTRVFSAMRCDALEKLIALYAESLKNRANCQFFYQLWLKRWSPFEFMEQNVHTLKENSHTQFELLTSESKETSRALAKNIANAVILQFENFTQYYILLPALLWESDYFNRNKTQKALRDQVISILFEQYPNRIFELAHQIQELADPVKNIYPRYWRLLEAFEQHYKKIFKPLKDPQSMTLYLEGESVPLLLYLKHKKSNVESELLIHKLFFDFPLNFQQLLNHYAKLRNYFDADTNLLLQENLRTTPLDLLTLKLAHQTRDSNAIDLADKLWTDYISKGHVHSVCDFLLASPTTSLKKACLEHLIKTYPAELESLMTTFALFKHHDDADEFMARSFSQVKKSLSSKPETHFQVTDTLKALLPADSKNAEKMSTLILEYADIENPSLLEICDLLDSHLMDEKFYKKTLDTLFQADPAHLEQVLHTYYKQFCPIVLTSGKSCVNDSKMEPLLEHCRKLILQQLSVKDSSSSACEALFELIHAGAAGLVADFLINSPHISINPPQNVHLLTDLFTQTPLTLKVLQCANKIRSDNLEKLTFKMLSLLDAQHAAYQKNPEAQLDTMGTLCLNMIALYTYRSQNPKETRDYTPQVNESLKSVFQHTLSLLKSNAVLAIALFENICEKEPPIRNLLEQHLKKPPLTNQVSNNLSSYFHDGKERKPSTPIPTKSSLKSCVVDEKEKQEGKEKKKKSVSFSH